MFPIQYCKCVFKVLLETKTTNKNDASLTNKRGLFDPIELSNSNRNKKKSPYTDAALIELNFTFLDTNENDRRIKLDMSPAVEKICVALDELLSLRDTGLEDFYCFFPGKLV